MATIIRSKYIVSLTREGRRQNRQTDLEKVLMDVPSVEVVEGRGRNTVTVLMPDAVCQRLEKSLPYATVLPYRSLELLSAKAAR